MACDFFGISGTKHIAVRRNTANFGGAGNFGLDLAGYLLRGRDGEAE
jgi:hypothetical protein